MHAARMARLDVLKTIGCLARVHTHCVRVWCVRVCAGGGGGRTALRYTV